MKLAILSLYLVAVLVLTPVPEAADGRTAPHINYLFKSLEEQEEALKQGEWIWDNDNMAAATFSGVRIGLRGRERHSSPGSYGPTRPPEHADDANGCVGS
ncbi:hypothetical protein E2562_022889 [Oryza meyeriana var. granulata]|uniref:Uncharacterized protein n=1 Tax=Oryza meyeriana var. granulata TaxID=110450 RepID=A0A6G1D6K3_9ORYZ|nr:hypothetical protein E2562_022889 [Oryza meyeriana var. granulata]